MQISGMLLVCSEGHRREKQNLHSQRHYGVQPHDTKNQQPAQLVIGLSVSTVGRLPAYRLKNGIYILNAEH